jgi:hypothetical protein
MANRVVFGELPGGGLGLRVSRPGYNVLDSALRDEKIAFDSRWPAAMRLIKSGSANTSGSAGVGATIMFGLTLAVEPMCFVITKAGVYYVNESVGLPIVKIQKDRIIVTGLPTNYTFSYYVFSQ